MAIAVLTKSMPNVYPRKSNCWVFACAHFVFTGFRVSPIRVSTRSVHFSASAAALKDDVGVTSASARGLPPLTAITLCLHGAPTSPLDPTAANVGRFPVGAALPISPAGRRPQLHFRGLRRHTARYGLTACSPDLAGPCHEASALAARSLRYRPTSSSLGLPPHRVFTPVRRTEKCGASDDDTTATPPVTGTGKP